MRYPALLTAAFFLLLLTSPHLHTAVPHGVQHGLHEHEACVAVHASPGMGRQAIGRASHPASSTPVEPAALGGGVLWVGGSGPGNYTSIQAAVDNASDGDTVIVLPGAYHETVLVDKSLSLIGREKDTDLPVIHGDGSDVAVNVTADRCLLSSLGIENMAAEHTCCDGVRVSGSHTRIDNLTITSSYDGLQLSHTEANTVTDVTVSNCSDDGMELQFCNNSVISDSYLHHNGDHGIYTWFSCSNVFSGNTVTDNSLGFLLHSFSDDNLVTGSEMRDNWAYALSVQGGSDNRLANNTLQASNWGIMLGKPWSTGNIVEYNTVVDNDDGILVEGKNILVRRNTVTGSNDTGIYVGGMFGGSRRCRIIENNLIDNGLPAYFRVGLLACNRWRGNYWSDWQQRTPRPVWGTVMIPIGMFFSLELPWCTVDWQPAADPHPW